MITSKVTSKAQTTIPQPIRTLLQLNDGDEIAYEIRKGRVLLSKVKPLPKDDPFGEFVEWDGDADRDAYSQL